MSLSAGKKVSLRKLKSMITVELAERSLSKSPFYLIYNITDSAKVTKNDRRLTKNPIKFYLDKTLKLDTSGLKNPAYVTMAENFVKLNDNLRRIGSPYLIKINNIYTTMRNVNTELLYFNTVSMVLISLLKRSQYKMVKVLTFKTPRQLEAEAAEAAAKEGTSTDASTAESVATPAAATS